MSSRQLESEQKIDFLQNTMLKCKWNVTVHMTAEFMFSVLTNWEVTQTCVFGTQKMSDIK